VRSADLGGGFESAVGAIFSSTLTRASSSALEAAYWAAFSAASSIGIQLLFAEFEEAMNRRSSDRQADDDQRDHNHCGSVRMSSLVDRQRVDFLGQRRGSSVTIRSIVSSRS
jgi:hypothetical protein